MRFLLFILACLSLVSCNSRKVKYSGLTDLVFGVHQILLYDNEEFYLELGMGGVEGKYEIKGDTVFLNYDDKPKAWPDKILITDEYFETVETPLHRQTIKITRLYKKE